jgi:hypothetical protein
MIAVDKLLMLGKDDAIPRGRVHNGSVGAALRAVAQMTDDEKEALPVDFVVFSNSKKKHFVVNVRQDPNIEYARRNNRTGSAMYFSRRVTPWQRVDTQQGPPTVLFQPLKFKDEVPCGNGVLFKRTAGAWTKTKADEVPVEEILRLGRQKTPVMPACGNEDTEGLCGQLDDCCLGPNDTVLTPKPQTHMHWPTGSRITADDIRDRDPSVFMRTLDRNPLVPPNSSSITDSRVTADDIRDRDTVFMRTLDRNPFVPPNSSSITDSRVTADDIRDRDTSVFMRTLDRNPFVS